MPKNKEIPPRADRMFENTKQFSEYDFPGAIADIIDNSISAKAKNIEIDTRWNSGDPEIRISDDGIGMTEKELEEAMEWASKGFGEKRDSHDLGRFGLGLKLASMSQCDHLLVTTTKNNKTSAMAWDYDLIQKNRDKWIVQVYSSEEIKSMDIQKSDGTQVIWTKCSGLSNKGKLTKIQFDELIAETLFFDLEKTFHRFIDKKNIDGSTNKNQISIKINGNKLEPYSPFFEDSPKLRKSDEITLNYENKEIRVQSYILPSWKDLNSFDINKIEGKDGTIENQGFYLYRNNRLIIAATWFGLRQKRIMSDLLRIKIDIDNSQDREWKISGNKRNAEMPREIKIKLNKFIEAQAELAKSSHKKKGKPIKDFKNKNIWRVNETRDGWKVEIDNGSVLIKNFQKELNKSENKDLLKGFKSILTLLQSSLPMEVISLKEYDSYISNPQENKRDEYIFSIKSLAKYYFSETKNKKEVIDKIKLIKEFSLTPELVIEGVELAYRDYKNAN